VYLTTRSLRSDWSPDEWDLFDERLPKTRFTKIFRLFGTGETFKEINDRKKAEKEQAMNDAKNKERARREAESDWFTDDDDLPDLDSEKKLTKEQKIQRFRFNFIYILQGRHKEDQLMFYWSVIFWTIIYLVYLFLGY